MNLFQILSSSISFLQFLDLNSGFQIEFRLILQFDLLQGENVANEGDGAMQTKANNKRNARNLEELYKKKHEEQEKARIEREAMIQAKKEEREAAEARRRALKEKMYKKTRSGQPVMKYRIEHMLETIKGSTS